MRIKIQVEEFRNGLNKILSVVDKKNLRPILSFTLVTTEENQLILNATDTEVAAKICLKALCSAGEKFCINAKNIFDILREFPNEMIDMELDHQNNQLKIFYQDIHFSILIYPADDYPALHFDLAANHFTLYGKQITQLIEKTSYSICNDETRPYLNGIFLQRFNQKLRAVATDGHRLSLFDCSFNTDQGSSILDTGVIVPRKGVTELKKIAENYLEDVITISVDDTFIVVQVAEEYYLAVRLVNREYPQYQVVIPKNSVYTVQADRNQLLNAVRRVKLMANEQTNGILMLLKKGEITIAANDPAMGEASEKLPVEYEGIDMEIGLNARFLIDILSTLEEGKITFELTNEISTVVIKSATNPDLLNIVMPLKL